MPNATKKTGQQLDLIHRRRRRFREVRRLAGLVETELRLMTRGCPGTAAQYYSDKAFAIAREWHGK